MLKWLFRSYSLLATLTRVGLPFFPRPLIRMWLRSMTDYLLTCLTAKMTPHIRNIAQLSIPVWTSWKPLRAFREPWQAWNLTTYTWGKPLKKSSSPTKYLRMKMTKRKNSQSSKKMMKGCPRMHWKFQQQESLRVQVEYAVSSMRSSCARSMVHFW